MGETGVSARPESADRMRERIRAALDAHRPVKVPAQGLTSSAVLMPLFVGEDGCRLLLTKRSQQVEHHKGQISFPGGAADPDDGSLLATALRETHEEVGVLPGDVEVLGRLDDITTLTGFRVTPFVGAIPHPYDYTVSEVEIDRLIEVPVSALLHNEHFEVNYAGVDTGRYVVYSFRYGGDVIWGATAKIITRFLNVVFGFEAPDLDWEET